MKIKAEKELPTQKKVLIGARLVLAVATIAANVWATRERGKQIDRLDRQITALQHYAAKAKVR